MLKSYASYTSWSFRLQYSGGSIMSALPPAPALPDTDLSFDPKTSAWGRCPSLYPQHESTADMDDS